MGEKKGTTSGLGEREFLKTFEEWMGRDTVNDTEQLQKQNRFSLANKMFEREKKRGLQVMWSTFERVEKQKETGEK